MASRASSSDRTATLVKKNLARFYPLMIIGFIWTVLVVITNIDEYHYSTMQELSNVIIGNFAQYGTDGANVLNLLYAAASALCVFGYLNKRTQAYMLHAFPLNRGTLFRAGIISGFLLFVIPLGCSVLIGVLMLLSVCPQAIGQFVFLQLFILVQYSFYFSLAVFSIQLTGSNVAAVFYYLFFNFVFVGTESILHTFFSSVLYGIQNSERTAFFSPFIYLFSLTSYHSDPDVTPIPEFLTRSGTYHLGLLIAAALIIPAAYLLYRKRKIETVGEVVAFRPLRPVFKWIVTFYATLLLGVLLNEVVFSCTDFFNLTVPCLICAAIGTAIGIFGSEMLLRRTVRVFTRKTFSGFLIAALILTGTVLAMKYDALHIQRRVEAPEKIASVEVSFDSYLPVSADDCETIQKITVLHQSVVDEHFAFDASEPPEYYSFINLSIRYTYKNGKTATRFYPLATYSNGYRLAGETFESRDICEAGIRSLRKRVGTITVEYRFAIDDEGNRIFNPANGEYSSYSHLDCDLTGGQIEGLLSAMAADCENGLTLREGYGGKYYDKDGLYRYPEVYLYDRSGFYITSFFVPENAEQLLAFLARYTPAE